MALRVPISFEFYPPKTDEQRQQLDRTAARLKSQSPEYVSCTFGAGGSTLSYTPETVQRLRDTTAWTPRRTSRAWAARAKNCAQLLKLYRALGCKRIVALRGDLPSGMARMGDFRYASDLVEFIREEHGGYFHIEVGCYPEMHPQAEDAFADLRHFKAKADAGADGAITQYFYNADAYFRFVDDARKLGMTSRSCPASCRSRTSRSCAASRKRAARRSRAGSASACTPTATMPRAFARSRPIRRATCVDASSTAARPPALLHAESLETDAERPRTFALISTNARPLRAVQQRCVDARSSMLRVVPRGPRIP